MQTPLTKKDARIWAKAQMAQMPSADRIIASRRIARSLADLIDRGDYDKVYLFAGKASEPNILSSLVESQTLRQQTWALPAVIDHEVMEFYQYSAGDSLMPNQWGILEPSKVKRVHPPKSSDLVLIPSVALTSNGQRLGHGNGYYDRYLTRCSGHPTLVGVCFEAVFAEAAYWTADSHDIHVSLICTENGVISSN